MQRMHACMHVCRYAWRHRYASIPPKRPRPCFGPSSKPGRIFGMGLSVCRVLPQMRSSYTKCSPHKIQMSNCSVKIKDPHGSFYRHSRLLMSFPSTPKQRDQWKYLEKKHEIPIPLGLDAHLSPSVFLSAPISRTKMVKHHTLSI